MEEDNADSTETKFHDAVFADLMSECKNNPPGARLSNNLRQLLESLRPGERRALVSRTKDECAPLLVAARRGNAELVEYLVHVCDADLEQRGVYEVPADRSRHSVTPLWCAAVAGRPDALRVLLDAGADVDAPSGTGSTPVRSACFMSHLETVRMLVAAGADIHRSNHNGGTCLINAVQSARLCGLLLDAGAAVNARDAQGKTALHYAVQEHRMESTRLLLQRGADPALRSHAGDDALRTAAIKGAKHILKMLLARGGYSVSRAADALELLGATQLDELNDVPAALATWRRATVLRHSSPVYVEKEFADETTEEGEEGSEGRQVFRRWARAGPVQALSGAYEWRTARELEAVAHDADWLRAQALLVVARVLGASHKDTLFRFMYRGAAYADVFRYQRCIDLWTWALEVRIVNDTVLSSETMQTALALTRLHQAAAGGRLARARGLPRAGDATRALELLVAALLAARPLLAVRPVCPAQLELADTALRCALHALQTALGAARGAVARRRVARAARRLLIVRTSSGETLLHLAVARQDLPPSAYFVDEPAFQSARLFPSAAAARLLLRVGAAASARDAAGSTPLHVAAAPHNFSAEIVDLLVEAGAHADQPNAFGDSALASLPAAARPLRHVTLACLCARALAALPAPPPGLMPRALQAFLQLHRPPAPLALRHLPADDV